ncbi:MAG: DUF2029 domain-containing protein [Acidobacteria bacterium]|nr:DUF2029 domain-containing protein [Acidobacteriota bacterium]
MWRKAALAYLGLAWMAASFAADWEGFRRGKDDFIPVYVAARSVGRPALHDQATYYRFMIERFGEVTRYGDRPENALRFIRPPAYALLLWPFGLFDYPTAHGLWLAARIAALGVFVWLWPAERRLDALVALSLSAAALAGLLYGQDAAFLLAAVAAARRWESRGRGFAAGAALSCGAIGFHLFALVPLALLAQRRFDILRGLAAGAAVWVAACFPAGGWDWIAAYWGNLTDGAAHPGAAIMPNLHGLLDGAPGAFELEVAAAVGAAALVWAASRRGDFADALSVALPAGLLISYHAYLANFLVILPAMLIRLERPQPPWRRIFTWALLAPPAGFLLLAGRPYSYGFQLALVVWFAATAAALLAEPVPAGYSPTRRGTSGWVASTLRRSSSVTSRPSS